jgi:hypothetical protein
MMAFDLSRSMENARRRMGTAATTNARRPRSDRGKSRLDPRVIELLLAHVGGYSPPSMTDVIRRLQAAR